MLGRFFSTAARKATRDTEFVDQDVELAREATEALRFAPMKPLRPPAAQNDDSLHHFCQAIEEDLRAAGYLQ